MPLRQYVRRVSRTQWWIGMPFLAWAVLLVLLMTWLLLQPVA